MSTCPRASWWETAGVTSKPDDERAVGRSSSGTTTKRETGRSRPPRGVAGCCCGNHSEAENRRKGEDARELSSRPQHPDLRGWRKQVGHPRLVPPSNGSWIYDESHTDASGRRHRLRERSPRDLLEQIPDRPISFEVFADDPGEMRRQALLIASWAENVYVKIPITTTDGESVLDLVSDLSADGVKVNVTAMMTTEQVRLAADALDGGPPVLRLGVRRADRRHRARSRPDNAGMCGGASHPIRTSNSSGRVPASSSICFKRMQLDVTSSP